VTGAGGSTTTTAASTGARDGALLGGRYRLQRCLAIGGAAAVWEGLDVTLDREVAVKILKPALTGDPTVVRRFRREAVAVARLNHPNVVAVFDTVSDGGREAIVMELVRGRTLRELLDVRGRLDVAEVIEIAGQVAAGLAAAHAEGIVHRDVKPGNVLAASDGRVLVADFGIAKAVGTQSDLTDERTMMGTAKYLSPEQVSGGPLDGRTDLYSLGLVMFEALTGTLPFLADTLEATALARLRLQPTPVHDLRPDVPYALAEIVDQLLRKERDRRIATAEEVIERLAAVTSDPTGERRRAEARSAASVAAAASRRPIPVHVGADRGRISRRLATASVGGLAVIAAGIGVLTWQAAERGDPPAAVEGAPSPPPTAEPEASRPPTTRGAFPQRRVPIARASVIDPPPANGDLWESRPAFVGDGDPATAWSIGGRAEQIAPGDGVGLRIDLVRELERPALTVTTEQGGWTAELYAFSERAAAPDGTLDVDDPSTWGAPIATIEPSTGTTVIGPLELDTVSTVIVWITSLAPVIPGAAPTEGAAASTAGAVGAYDAVVNEITVLGR
jgi:eukaryotic-like serine/threonine-protein kinase